MKPSEFYEVFCALQGANPRPQPWQMDIVDRLWAVRLKRQREGKMTPLLLATTNWGSGGRWFYDHWVKSAEESSPFRSFFLGMDLSSADGDKSVMAVVQKKPREKGPSTILFYDEVAEWPRQDMRQCVIFKPRSVGCSWATDIKVRRRALEVDPPGEFTTQYMAEFRDDVKAERISDREAALKLAMQAIAIAEPATEPKKKARVPFYQKFTPKRRLQ